MTVGRAGTMNEAAAPVAKAVNDRRLMSGIENSLRLWGDVRGRARLRWRRITRR
jgi:hypothetical protein